MKSNLKLSIFSSFVIVYLLMKFHMFVETTYLISFFTDNIIFLFVSFIFINATALGIVLLELNEAISGNTDESNFSRTTKQIINAVDKQMKLVNKQIILVVISIVFVLLVDSIFIQNNQDYILFCNIFIITFFIYEFTILYDTVRSVFVVR